MNKRVLTKLEQGEETTLLGKLLLTRRQRQVVLKWLLLSAGYLLLQVLQDVVFSRVRILGGCPDLVPGYLLLVCLLQGPGSGGLFALCAGVLRCLSGAVLGPVSLVILTFSGILLSIFRRACLRRQFWAELLCCWLGLAIHQGLLFGLGLFLGSTAPERWVACLGGTLGACLAAALLYLPVKAMGSIGGSQWNE